MALTLSQKNWIKSPGRMAEDIVGMFDKGRLDQVAYFEFADSEARLAAQAANVRALLENRPDPAEMQEYADIKNLLAGASADQSTYDAAVAYVQKWGDKPYAADHVREIGDAINALDREKVFAHLRDQVNRAFAEYNTRQVLPHKEVQQSIRNFINTYAVDAAAAQMVQTCQNWNQQIVEMNRAVLVNACRSLFDAEGKIRDVGAVNRFLHDYNVEPAMRDELDSAVWAWAMAQPDVLKAGEIYNNVMDNRGRHSGEVQSLAQEYQEWQTYSNGSIYDVMDYLTYHPNGVFADQARLRINQLRGEELDKIRRAPNKYPFDAFMQLRRSGMFSDDELAEAAGAANDPDLFGAILDSEAIKMSLPPQPNTSELGSGTGDTGVTDVLFFGVPNCGKTCVLSGLLVNQGLSYNSVAYSGKYAQLVETYTRAGVALDGTATGFIATIQCNARRGDRKYRFNLFEVSGESFKGDIAGAESLNFEDMGDGATEILSSDNDKIFFILLDPTNNRVQRTEQYNVIKNFINLLFGAINGESTGQDMLERVRGLHFIVTKADTMADGDWRDGALRHVQQLLTQNDIDDIVSKCKEHGINYSVDERVNGHPRVFPFSLGHFTVGNIFRYKPESSSNILEVILDYCTPERDRTFFDKLRRTLTNT